MRKTRILALAAALVMALGLIAGAAAYTVAPGDVLWKIAKNFGTDYKTLAEYNGIANPNLIYPGQVIKWDEAEAPAPAPEPEFKTFTATARGFGGDVVVTATFKDGELHDITAVGADETAGIGSVALERIPAKMLELKTAEVDAISGATETCYAIKEATVEIFAAAGFVGSAPEVPTEPTDKTIVADIVVVGAGGAGMTAAVTAANEGKSVVILEKTGMVGGNTTRSTGGMNAAATPEQTVVAFTEAAGLERTLSTAAVTYPELAELTATVQAQYDTWSRDRSATYFDSVELFMLDTLVGGRNINDYELVKTFAEKTADGIAWLKTIGADLVSVGSFGGASVKRIHRPVDADGRVLSVGAYLVPVLEKACADAGVEIYFDAKVTEIVMADGKAVGVKADGLTVEAGAVIIATGGFGANLPMVVELAPALEGFVTTNAPGATGDGIAMAVAAGAATVDMEQIQIHPTVEQDTSALITEGLRGDGAILVNANGLRFTDEVGTRDVVSAAEVAQPGGFAWILVDKKMVDASTVIAGYIRSGLTAEGETFADLAAAMDVPADAFVATMDTWNAAVEAGVDAEFGRTSFAKPLNVGPFYAVKVGPGVHHTMGGLKINTAAEVISTAGAPIPGLFAAGEVTGGIHGANRLGGNAVADIVVFGRIAGASAVAYAK